MEEKQNLNLFNSENKEALSNDNVYFTQDIEMVEKVSKESLTQQIEMVVDNSAFEFKETNDELTKMSEWARKNMSVAKDPNP